MKRSLVILFFFSTLASALGQQSYVYYPWWTPGLVTSLPSTDSLSVAVRNNVLDLDFDHTLSLYRWSASGKVMLPRSASLFTLPSASATLETRSKLRQDTRTRTSEGALVIGASYPLVEDALAATATLFGTTYSLNTTASGSIYDIGTLQNLSDGYALVGTTYRPDERLTFSAAAGMAYKSFLYGSSSGSIFQAKGILDSILPSEDIYLEASGWLDERRFPSLGEAMRNDGAKVQMLTGFGDGGSNTITAGIVFKRRDFYFNVDTTLNPTRQERSEYSVELREALRYPLVPEKLTAIVTADFYPRSVSRSTTGIDFSTAASSFLTSSTFLLPSSTSAFDLSIASRLEWLLRMSEQDASVSAELRFSENSETNQLTISELPFLSSSLKERLTGIFEATGFDGQQSILTLSGYLPVGTRDALQVTFSSRLFRYDTPSDDNHDDRDELYLNSVVLYRHQFDEQLSSSAQVRLSQNHLVYLASDRSAQNFSGNTISLQLATLYDSRSARNAIAAEVFANYSIYDFDLPQFEQFGGRDYLIRGINASDSLRIDIGKAPLFPSAMASIETILNLRLYERGAYNSENFSERPLLATTEISAEGNFVIADRSIEAPILLKLGARLFYQLRSAPETIQSTSLVDQEKIERFGPVATIILDRLSMTGLRLYSTVWYSTLTHTLITSNNRTSSTLVEGRLGVQWTF